MIPFIKTSLNTKPSILKPQPRKQRRNLRRTKKKMSPETKKNAKKMLKSTQTNREPKTAKGAQKKFCHKVGRHGERNKNMKKS